MKKILSILALGILILGGCKKDFLTKVPIASVTPQTAFVTYTNFQTYANGLYDYFAGYGNGATSSPPVFGSQEVNSDNIVNAVSGGQSIYSLSTKLPPAQAPVAGSASGSMGVIAQWDFSYVRRVDVMLDNIAQSSMVQSDKDHWTSVGYFFRALRYYDLIAAYGDVPWIEHSITDTSKSVLFATRTPRDVVATNILNNLIWAESHIKPAGDGVNTINQACVQFLISRFGLFEGTWRKYHNLPNATTYLNACVTYSQKLMVNYPTIMSSYDDVYNSEDLTGKPGIILFKAYVANTQILTQGASATSDPNDQVSRYVASTSWAFDVPKSMIESYLCTDGNPIGTSPLYQKDTSMYSAFRNRDRRLYFTVVPPYRVKFITPSKTSAAGASNTLWTKDPNPAYSEYLNLMNALPNNVNKALPFLAQSADGLSGNVIPNSPHFTVYNVALSNLPTSVAIPQAVTQLGYFYWKPYNRAAQDASGDNTNDCPLFRIEETLLNYAEAQAELGQFTQAIANQTINVLRPRANVANMVVANINAAFDPARDQTVDPVVWEIRRERRVELFGDGFRFNDLKRWAKGTYFNNYPLGVFVRNADYGNKLTLDGGGATGYVKYFNAPATGWNDKYYLEPLPLQELLINPNLVQNPGW